MKKHAPAEGRRNQGPQENKMGVTPVNKLLLSMAAPIMVSMIVQALYNVVDSYFVAKISENALTALSLAFPVQNLMMSVSLGIGVGVNALTSRALGLQDRPRAERTAMQGMLLGVISFLVFVLVGAFLVPVFMRGQTDVQEIVTYGTQYLTICCCCSIGVFLQIVNERILQSTGRTLCTMFTQGTGAIINIVLDPILIFGLLGFPAMGVRGAAWATVIGQCCAALFALVLNITRNRDVRLRLANLKPSLRVIGRILFIGAPSMLMIAIGSIMVFFLNRILLGFSVTAAAVFGVYFKLQSFVFMPVFGLNNGMVPIIGYNYGAGKRDRIVKTYRLAVTYGIFIMCLGLALFQFEADWLLALFEASPAMTEMGVTALRIISVHFPLAGFSIVTSSLLQALGRSMYSLYISAIRQLLALTPIAWLLSLSGELNLVWWAFPLAEVVAILLCLLFKKRTIQGISREMEQRPAGAAIPSPAGPVLE